MSNQVKMTMAEWNRYFNNENGKQCADKRYARLFTERGAKRGIWVEVELIG